MPESFDRKRPLYRLFDMEDGTRQWWTVSLDNTPGRAAEEHEVAVLEAYIDKMDWGPFFWAAYKKHKKATVYANKVPDFDLPDGCKAVIYGRVIPWQGRQIAMGCIYKDREERWFDGYPVNTSPIVEGPDADGIFRTENSTYKLVIPDD